MEITNKLRKLLMDYASTDVYRLNAGSRATVAGIHIAISLYELGEFKQRPIAVEEELWFKGSYSITREFDSDEWEDIPNLYDEIVSLVTKKHFFRSA